MTLHETDVPLAAFAGVPTYARMPHRTDLTNVDVAVLGVPFDGTVTFRSGQRFGPRAVRTGSSTVGGYNPAQQIDPFSVLTCVDHGDVPVVPGNTQRSLAAIERAVARVVAAGAVPLLFGGDHSCTLGHLRGMRRHGPVAVIDFDAHTDSGDNYFGERYSHGTWFRRAVEEELVSPEHSTLLGLRGSIDSPDGYQAVTELGAAYLTTDQVAADLASAAATARERAGDRPVYVTFDLDVIDPAFAPGTGCPEPGGITSREAIALLRALGPLDYVGFDVVELIAEYDPAAVTAVLAGNLGFEMLSLLARRRTVSPEVAS
ncbi:agmatinase [Streptomyces flaveolus]|uniref:Agmatinase n=1 Tax=Streptomyces flaveolus TaxID=67297 RepID=A0ABV3AD63_9ACTN